MKEIIIYDNIEWWRYPLSKYRNQRVYFQKGSPKISRLLHRYIWIKFNGEIPNGYEIHHKDGNQNNNDISNLELLSKKDHMVNGNKVHRKNREWHKTEVGIEIHSKIGEKVKMSNNIIIGNNMCSECDNIINLTKHQPDRKFCSDRCRKRSSARTFRKKHGHNGSGIIYESWKNK